MGVKSDPHDWVEQIWGSPFMPDIVLGGRHVGACLHGIGAMEWLLCLSVTSCENGRLKGGGGAGFF